MIQILRQPAVLKAVGRERTSLALEIAEGTFPPPISLGARAKGWPDYEVEQTIKWRIAGLEDDEIREAVAKMVKERELLRGVA